MAPGLDLRRDRSAVMRTVAFGAVVLAFFTTNFFVQRESNGIVRDSAIIVNNAAPSIHRLVAVRRSVLAAERALFRLQDHPEQHPEAAADLTRQLAEVERSTRAYLALSPLESERPVRMAIQNGWARFDLATRRPQLSSDPVVQEAIRDEVAQTRLAFLEQLTRAIELNAEVGQQVAERIAETRRRNNRLAIALNIVCAALTAVVAWLLHRQFSARRALVAAYTHTVEQRAEELEQFAGRVAHDVRNPLSAAKLAADLALRQAEPARQDLLQRILRNLARAEAITSGLLDFARSGAQPDPGVRTEPRAVISDLFTGLAPEAEAQRIDLRAEPIPPVRVACSTGVYLSLVTNLVRNAMKYLGESTARRVVLRVEVEGDRVRTTVEDTGPGISEEKLPYLFDAYFRASRTGPEGLGLGLATVKKLAEGHGGEVGVRSRVGEGTRIWFTLPNAGAAAPHA